MNDAEKFENIKNGLRFCPECGQPTVQNPRFVFMVGCSMHGDFMLLWIEGDLIVRWRTLAMKPVYSDWTSPQVYFDSTRIESFQIRDIGERYIRGEISFIEACKMIAVAQGKEFPDNPSSEDLMEGHNILDGLGTLRKLPSTHAYIPNDRIW